MDHLFSHLAVADIHHDLLRNIVSLNESEDPFDDLSSNTEECFLARQVESDTRPLPYHSHTPETHRPFEEACGSMLYTGHLKTGRQADSLMDHSESGMAAIRSRHQSMNRLTTGFGVYSAMPALNMKRLPLSAHSTLWRAMRYCLIFVLPLTTIQISFIKPITPSPKLSEREFTGKAIPACSPSPLDIRED